MKLHEMLRVLFYNDLVNHSNHRHLRLMSKLKYGDWYFPRDIGIEIGTVCDRRCVYCPQSFDPLPDKRITEGTFVQILHRLREIDWSGTIGYTLYNEPLMDERLVWFVTKTKEFLPKALPRIITNGDRLDGVIFQRLVAAGVVKFIMTHHDSDPTDWEERIYPLVNQYPEYFFLQDLHDKPVSNRGGLIKNLSLKVMQGCNCPPEVSLPIALNGDVLFCCSDYHHKHVFGNIITEGLMKVWNKTAFKKHREYARQGNPVLAMCKGCYGL